MKYITRAFETAAFIMPWFGRAMADGVISPQEMAEFITEIARIWKIRVNIEVPANVGSFGIIGQFERDDE